jgi:hypothetical protein
LFWLSEKRKGWGEKNADEIERKEATVCLHGGLENGHSRGQTHVHTDMLARKERNKERKERKKLNGQNRWGPAGQDCRNYRKERERDWPFQLRVCQMGFREIKSGFYPN